MLTHCLPANVNNVPLYIFAGALSMLPAWRCAPAIHPKECIKKYWQYFPVHFLGSRQCIVSVHCREEGCIGLYIPDDQEISRGPRDVPRAKPEGNLEVGGDVQPNISRLEAVYGHSLIINPYQGMYQEIHPCRAGSIGSVEINTSLLMMREW